MLPPFLQSCQFLLLRGDGLFKFSPAFGFGITFAFQHEQSLQFLFGGRFTLHLLSDSHLRLFASQTQSLGLRSRCRRQFGLPGDLVFTAALQIVQSSQLLLSGLLQFLQPLPFLAQTALQFFLLPLDVLTLLFQVQQPPQF